MGRELLATELESLTDSSCGLESSSVGGSDRESVSGSAAAAQAPAHPLQQQQGGPWQGRGRHVLLGHSMGAACAAAEAIENAEVRIPQTPVRCAMWRLDTSCTDELQICSM